MAFGFTFEAGGFTNHDPPNGVSIAQMSRVVENYIEQEKGVRIVVRPMVGETVAHLYGIPPSTSIEKQLLFRAYAWAKDHLKQ